MKRLFIAADISEEARAIASELIHDLRTKHTAKGVSWVRPENLHVTIKFLGDTDEQLEGKLTELLSDIASPSPRFKLRLDGPEVLGKRVMSIKVATDTPAIFDLEKRIDTGCGSLGFKPEGRRFHPHLTLARIRDPRNAHAVIREFCDKQIARVEFDVGELVLYESKLTSSGSIYSRLGKFALGPSQLGVPPLGGTADRERPPAQTKAS